MVLKRVFAFCFLIGIFLTAGVWAQSCIDTEGSGPPQANIGGTVNEEGDLHDDMCISSSQVRDYYCDGNNNTAFTTLNCATGSGYVCANAPTGDYCTIRCVDTDGGENYEVAGYVHDNLDQSDTPDLCGAGSQTNNLTEQYCDVNHIPQSRGVDCKAQFGQDYICQARLLQAGINEARCIQSCIDSDGGSGDVATPGSVTINQFQSQSIVHDQCNGNFIVEQFCHPNGTPDFADIFCPNGCELVGGRARCIPDSNTCTDQDDGQNEAYTASFAANNTRTRYDYCWSDTRVADSACVGEDVVSNVLNCNTGDICYDSDGPGNSPARCVAQTCFDSEVSDTDNYGLPAQSAATRGSVTITGQGIQWDGCVDGDTVAETYCAYPHDTVFRSSPVNCQAGQICSNGACVVGGGAVCGNNNAEAGEQCGEPGLSCTAGQTCSNCLCVGGSGCVGGAPNGVCDATENGVLCPQDCVCGNGAIDGNEQCDTNSNLNGQTCTSIGQGFTGGTLRCYSGCTFDTTQCTSSGGGAVCGDGDVEGDEECDDGNTDSGDGCSSTCEDEEIITDVCDLPMTYNLPAGGTGQITSCSHYTNMSSTTIMSERKDACNRDCGTVAVNDAALSGNPGSCEWIDSENECVFAGTSLTGELCILRYDNVGQCEQGESTRLVDYTRINATGSYDPINCPTSCGTETCQGEVPCTRVIELNFFNWENFVATVVVIGIVYIIFSRGKNEED